MVHYGRHSKRQLLIFDHLILRLSSNFLLLHSSRNLIINRNESDFNFSFILIWVFSLSFPTQIFGHRRWKPTHAEMMKRWRDVVLFFPTLQNNKIMFWKINAPNFSHTFGLVAVWTRAPVVRYYDEERFFFCYCFVCTSWCVFGCYIYIILVPARSSLHD